jgi:hypothetical protein
VRRLFEEKKIRVVAPTANITTLKGNARKNLQILTRFRAAPVGQGERSALQVLIFLPEFFFYY